MNAPLFNIRDLPSKSFLLSIIVHVSILNIFIIVWPVLPEPHKPNIIFLGSILRASDILGQAIPQSQQNGRPANGVSFAVPQKNLFETGLEKPAVEKKYTPQQKRTMKSAYEESPKNDKEEGKPSLKNMTIDAQLEPYKPLRLKTND